jgi:NodT family efflux transporter outer membrane factor (OMF) lipoprotein
MPVAAGPALDPTALARWWQQFDDPLLSALVDEAWQGNTDLAAARARLAQARALRDSQAAGSSPQLGSSAGVSRNQTRQSGSSSWQAGLDASWEPDFFGGQSAALRARELDVAGSAADLATTRMAVAAEVGIAYVTLRGTRRQLTIARENLATQEQTLQLAQWRAQAGLVSSLDAAQARLSTAQLRANLPALESSIAQTEHRLALLLGRPPASLRERLGRSDTLPTSGRELPAGVPAEVLRLRPDLRAAELAIRAEAERLAARQADRWPSFSLSGSLALKAATLSGLGGAGALASAVAAAVNWPIWDGGARSAAMAQQQAVLDQANVAYRAAVLGALEDVENALTALGATRRESMAREEAREIAANTLLLARQRYQAGLIDFGSLLDAQRSALAADTSLANARSDLSLNLIRLYKALGGGWGDDGNPSAQPVIAPTAPAVPTS